VAAHSPTRAHDGRLPCRRTGGSLAGAAGLRGGWLRMRL